MTNNLGKAVLRKEIVEVNFKAQLEKHLTENEIICTDCGGLGMMIDNNKFGITGYEDPDYQDPSGLLFPLKKQSLTFCQCLL